jgi:phage terminase large subunit
MELTPKQTIALDFLEDENTREVLFGGSAGGGKSALGCYWQLKKRIQYPETVGCIARERLKDLKETTLMTFFEIAQMQGMSDAFTYNAQNNRINFKNGSVIFLKELFHYPSDPEFVGLGSLELTDAFIDEAGGVAEKAKIILSTRIRKKLINGMPKLLMSANPTKNWLYRDIYRPYADGKLPLDVRYVPSTAFDNKHISPEYIKALDRLKGVDRERLRNGNWEYSESDKDLMMYNDILEMFDNDYCEKGKRYISADIATSGADLLVIGLWDGLMLEKVWIREKSEGDEILDLIKSIKSEYQVNSSRIVFDGDGVGSMLKGFLRRSIRFHNGGMPIRPKRKTRTGKPEHIPYANLKTQCAYLLADLVTEGEVGIKPNAIPDKYKDRLISEFQQLKRKNVDDDNKKWIISKEEMKENLGFSPDFLDMFIMRMYFEV